MPTTPGSPVSFSADDGLTLSGRWFEPVGTPTGVVLVVPGMGIRGRYYAEFATWLASRSYAVLTFDFRGYGESSRGHLRHVDADAVRWAKDAAAALAYLHDRSDGLPVTWIGHSFGAQVLPFADHTLVDRAVNVTAGTGYWRLNPLQARVGAPLLWTVIAPAAISLTGYFPGRSLRVLDDLPPGVMRQWSRWCMHPDYLFGEFPGLRETFAEVRLPLLSISFTDDELMSRESISTLNDYFPGTQQTRVRLSPAQVDREKVGHFGFFRGVAPGVWDELLLAHLGRRTAPA